MIRLIAVFVLGACVALLGRQALDLREAYDAVTTQWKVVREADRRRGPVVQAAIAFAEHSGAVAESALADIQDDLASVQGKAEQEDVLERKQLETYDRNFMRLGHDTQELCRSLHAAPLASANSAFSPLQSRFEGTESAAWQAHMNYNAVALDYMTLISHRLNHVMARVLSLPIDIGMFEAFGESGPKGPTSNGAADDDD